MRKLAAFLLAAISAVVVSRVESQEPVSQDEKAIRQVVASFVDAYNKEDAAAVAAHWTEDGVSLFPGTGERIAGRKAIEDGLKESFAEAGKAVLEVQIDSIRVITSDTAVEEGQATVLHPGEPPEISTYTAVHVKKNGKWLLNTVTETDLPAPPPPSPYEYLSELEWMIGAWVDQDEHVEGHTVCRWTRNGSFMTRSFSLTTDDGEVFDGTEVIGWDPVHERIRGWVFDSDGGFAHEVWDQKDNAWTVTAHGVLPDGRTGTSVRVITKIDDNNFTTMTVSREVDSELLPNIGPITVVRKPGS